MSCCNFVAVVLLSLAGLCRALFHSPCPSAPAHSTACGAVYSVAYLSLSLSLSLSLLVAVVAAGVVPVIGVVANIGHRLGRLQRRRGSVI